MSDPQQTAESGSFSGFDYPDENWCKLPLALIENLDKFSSKAELAVTLYVLRHTWGYKEYNDFKGITVDEFANGRKKKDGIRIDRGTGLTLPT